MKTTSVKVEVSGAVYRGLNINFFSRPIAIGRPCNDNFVTGSDLYITKGATKQKGKAISLKLYKRISVLRFRKTFGTLINDGECNFRFCSCITEKIYYDGSDGKAIISKPNNLDLELFEEMFAFDIGGVVAKVVKRNYARLLKFCRLLVNNYV